MGREGRREDTKVLWCVEGRLSVITARRDNRTSRGVLSITSLLPPPLFLACLSALHGPVQLAQVVPLVHNSETNLNTYCTLASLMESLQAERELCIIYRGCCCYLGRQSTGWAWAEREQQHQGGPRVARARSLFLVGAIHW